LSLSDYTEQNLAGQLIFHQLGSPEKPVDTERSEWNKLSVLVIRLAGVGKVCIISKMAGSK